MVLSTPGMAWSISWIQIHIPAQIPHTIYIYIYMYTHYWNDELIWHQHLAAVFVPSHIYIEGLILFQVALVPIATATEQLPNLAEHQPAWQTSTGYDAEASRCVDGDLSIQFASGSCSHTVYPSSVGAVWGVDLENVSDIYYVEVLNRDGGNDQLINGYFVAWV